MELTLSDEDNLLTQVVSDIGTKWKLDSPPRGQSRSNASAWQELVELGLIGLGTTTDVGGAGGNWLQASLVVQVLARLAFDQPYLGCGILAPSLLALAGAESGLLESALQGTQKFAVGLKPDLSGIACIGEDAFAVGFDCEGADSILVLASRDSPRLARTTPTEWIDSIDISSRLCRADMSEQSVEEIAGDLTEGAISRWETQAMIAVSADLLGVMEGSSAVAVSHARERIQFGVPIGSFQAIQHLLADQYVSSDASLWAVRYAAWCVDEDESSSFLAARTCKAYTSDVARTVCETTVQVLGGMGFLWDSWAHVYLRRAILGSRIFGNHDEQVLEINNFRRVSF
jgi:alkylation response protein AidB-like acyl-CoA dehydrogenase